MGFDPTALMIAIGGIALGVVMTLAIVRGLITAAASELTTFRQATVAYAVFVFTAIFVSACGAADGGPPNFRDTPQQVILGILALCVEYFYLLRRPGTAKSDPTRPAETGTTTSMPLPAADSSQQFLENATRKLAAHLSENSKATFHAAAPPNQEVTSARSKVEAARDLIRSRRLDYALGRCIPDHIQHWGSWSKREDFQQWVNFDCANIRAEEAKENEANGTVEVVTVQFEFNGSQYAIVLRNEGMSPIPGLSAYTGTIDLWHVGQHVAKFSIYNDISKEFSHWQFSDVTALRVGPWIRDILDIAAQIDAREEHSRQGPLNEIVLKAARNIDLG